MALLDPKESLTVVDEFDGSAFLVDVHYLQAFCFLHKGERERVSHVSG